MPPRERMPSQERMDIALVEDEPPNPPPILHVGHRNRPRGIYDFTSLPNANRPPYLHSQYEHTLHLGQVNRKEFSDSDESDGSDSSYSSSEDVIGYEVIYGSDNYDAVKDDMKKASLRMDVPVPIPPKDDCFDCIVNLGLREALEYNLVYCLNVLPQKMDTWLAAALSLCRLKDSIISEYDLTKSDNIVVRDNLRRNLPTRQEEINSHLENMNLLRRRVNAEFVLCKRWIFMLESGANAIKTCIPFYEDSIQRLQDTNRYSPIVETRELNPLIEKALTLHRNMIDGWHYGKQTQSFVQNVVAIFADDIDELSYSSTDDMPQVYRVGIPQPYVLSQDNKLKAKKRAMLAEMGVERLTRKQELRIQCTSLRGALDRHWELSNYQVQRRRERAERRSSREYKHQRAVAKVRRSELRRAAREKTWDDSVASY
jgi:hypothetical protein